MAAVVSRYSPSSPTARLLRNSRLFAIPNPLPKPALAEYAHIGDGHFTSDTVTLPYPTEQAIRTPNRLRKRGEWGLKRRLPLRATKQAAGITVSELDTLDQITDFIPATPHTKTLVKMQEMQLAITRPSFKSNKGSVFVPPLTRSSAFDEDWDHTSITVRKTPKTWVKDPFLLPKRWRVRGPDLKSMAEGDFADFLHLARSRAGEFTAMLKSWALDKYMMLAREKAQISSDPTRWLLNSWLETLERDKSEFIIKSASLRPGDKEKFAEFISPFFKDSTNLMLVDIKPETILKNLDPAVGELGSQFEQYWEFYLAEFRENATTSSSNRSVVEEFLDLPASKIEDLRPNVIRAFANTIRRTRVLPTDSSWNTSLITLTTHPSAGISYHRTSKVLANHPFFGPISPPAAHVSRLLYNKPHRFLARFAGAVYGLGGVAVRKDQAVTMDALTSEDSDALSGRSERGQGRHYVHVEHGKVDVLPDGRIRMEVGHSDSGQYVRENRMGTDLIEFWRKMRDRDIEADEMRRGVGVKIAERALPINVSQGMITGSFVDD